MSDSSVPDMPTMIAHARALREMYTIDQHRPGYHFVCPEGVHAPVDPNGAIFWIGRYHLCYIYQNEGKHYWGHISSIDLVHWRSHPPALVPGGADDGIFSGGAFIDKNGVATYTYWGLGNPCGICLATSTDPLLETWEKHPANPVIRETAGGLTEVPGANGAVTVVYGAADPSAIWTKDGRYYMLTGNLLVLVEFGQNRGLPEYLGDTTYLFVSDDLDHWTYLHKFYESKREWTRETEDDMCPDFFPLPSSPDGGADSGTHMMLFISHNMGCQYYLGKYAEDRFEPRTHERMTWVDNEYFAPESLADSRGRRIMWAWVFDRREQASKEASGWSGELSLPRVLWLGDDGTLRMRPVPELDALRYNVWDEGKFRLEAGEDRRLESIQCRSLDLVLEADVEKGAQLVVTVCRSPDGSEATDIVYDPAAATLSIDTRKSSLGEGTKAIETGSLTLPPGEPLRLRVLVDKSFVEVFANDRQAVCRRIYPTRADSTGCIVSANGAAVTVASCRTWDMMPSNAW